MTLSLHGVSQAYFERLFVAKTNASLTAQTKAKVLLVDAVTMPIVSMSYTQSQLLQQDVVLVEMLENAGRLAAMKHLNCVVFASARQELVAAICAELAHPHYAQYQVFFNNTVGKPALEKLAQADEHEVTSQVVELFQDFRILNDNFFHVDVPGYTSNPALAALEAQALLSVLLATKKCPVILYDGTLVVLKRLASEVLYYINQNSNNNLFDEANRTSDTAPVLLVVDRKADPLTPLVTPWTYQLMVYELIGISNNVARVGDESLTLLLADAFFSDAMYSDYGELTDKFQRLVDEYKTQTKQLSIENLKTQDLLELKRILTRFPEFKKLSNTILRHLLLIGELDAQILAQNLWLVGELQQTIACGLESHQSVRAKLAETLQDPLVSTLHKVRLLLLYTSKNPSQDVAPLLRLLEAATPPPTQSQVLLVKTFNRHYTPSPGRTEPDGLFGKNRIKIQHLFNSLERRNDNIYMQYAPRLGEALAAVLKPEQPLLLAALTPDTVAAQYGKARAAPLEIFVYLKGGATYEEARLVHEYGRANGVSCVVGGDRVLNSALWLASMCEQVHEAPEAAPDRRQQLRDIL